MRSGSASQMFAAGALAMLWIGLAAPEDAVAGDVALIQDRLPSVAELAGLLWPQQTQAAPEPRRTRSLKWNRDNLALTPKPEPAVASDEPHGFSFPDRVRL